MAMTYRPSALSRPLWKLGGLLGLALSLTMMPAAFAVAEEYPKAIQGAIKSGVKVVKQFPAASGMTGWVLKDEWTTSIIYTTPDKKTVVLGTLIDENGQDLNALYAKLHVPEPDLSDVYDELKRAAYVVEGPVNNPKNIIYVFVDANCPFCHFTWRALQAYQQAGLQVRWLLVDTLGPTSLPKAIEVLAANDTTRAFRKMEESHGKPWESTLKVKKEIEAAITERIRHNGKLMMQLGIMGTPGVVWKNKDGKVHIKAGMPRLSELPAITGLPEQKIEDPELQRFR